MNTENKEFKSGFVAIAGRPNSGKSTLLNKLSGMRLAIVSSKPQTTRHNIKLILNDENSQIIFTDTPGIHLPKNKLGKRMQESVSLALKDSDIILLMIDATKPDITQIETGCCEFAKENGKKIILLINKIDLIAKEYVLPLITKYSNSFEFDSIIPVSVKKSDGLDLLKNEIIRFLPFGPKYYPDDVFTDQTERLISSELIREQILKFTSQEIPHGTAVEIDKFEDGENDNDDGKEIVVINASIYCEKDSHKKMLIGKNGEMIKRIGTNARREIENLIEKKVFLDLHVKVRKDWRNNYTILKTLGFDKK